MLLIVVAISFLSVNNIIAEKYRVIVTTDFPPIPVVNSDPDDVQSMIRFLLYSNEFDIEGLIASAATFEMVADKYNILTVIDKYEKVECNLRKRDVNYPTAEYLRSITYEGLGNNHNIEIKWGCEKQSWEEIIGEGKDSEASDAIIAAVDKPDLRPVYICVWGGPRELAQAIWRVQNSRDEKELEKFISKLRVFLIACQDATHNWLMDSFPNLFIIESRNTYYGMFGADDSLWVDKNIRSVGPLGEIYPLRAIAGEGVIEGDSPSFLYLVSANRGINNPEDPTQPSWGGQYIRVDSTNHYVDGYGAETIKKWVDDFQKEFKERAKWMMP